MSKRHTDIFEQPPVPTDLRFYAPLLYNDLVDRVSGVIPTQGTAQVAWDNAEQSYRFITTTGGQLAFIYNIQGINVHQQPYAYTCIAKVKLNSFTGTCDVLTVGKTGSEGTSSALMETHRHNGITTGAWHTIAMVLQGDSLIFYLDGAVARTGQRTQYAGCDPANWGSSDRQNNLTVCGGFHSYRYDAYVKDVYVFDRVSNSSLKI